MSLLGTMTERRAAKKEALDELLAGPTAEQRDLNDVESAKFDELVAEIRKQDERIAELGEQAKREQSAAAVRSLLDPEGKPEQRIGGAQVTDAPVYTKENLQRSYFRDLYQARHKGDAEAADRLRRSDKQTAEKRALTTVAGAGGEFAPPVWLIDEFVKLARAGRKFADSLAPMSLPTGLASINIPKVTGGTTTAIQATNNSALSQTDMTTGSVSSSISTIGGKQVVSMQLLSQSGIPFDQVILGDLAADYARAFDNQVINGSNGSGQLNGVYTYFAASGTVNRTYTQATPAVGGAGGLYANIFAAASSIETARYLPPDTVWMHPRRWNWILSSSDTSNRPLVVPAGVAYNTGIFSDGNGGVGAAEGVVGSIGSLNVVTDANIPTNVNSTQDTILVGIKSDLKLWESALEAETFEQTYADSAGVLFRVLAYSALIPSRYTTSVSVVTGTGLASPTF